VGQVEWKLKSVMEKHGIKPLDIEREAIRLGYDIGKNVVYRVATERGPQRIDRSTLEALLGALRSLTGTPVNVSDLIVYKD
jgi:hypothetical protein